MPYYWRAGVYTLPEFLGRRYNSATRWLHALVLLSFMLATVSIMLWTSAVFLNKVLGMDSEAERRIAVIGIPDAQRGEAIVLLSTISGPAIEQECIDLRYKLLDEGLPSLWCPKQILPVKEIPVLASGKLDIKGCEALVS